MRKLVRGDVDVKLPATAAAKLPVGSASLDLRSERDNKATAPPRSITSRSKLATLQTKKAIATSATFGKENFIVVIE